MSRPYSNSESQFVLASYSERKPLEWIAGCLGRTPSSVSQHRSRLARHERIRDRNRSLTGSAEA